MGHIQYNIYVFMGREMLQLNILPVDTLMSKASQTYSDTMLIVLPLWSNKVMTFLGDL